MLPKSPSQALRGANLLASVALPLAAASVPKKEKKKKKAAKKKATVPKEKAAQKKEKAIVLKSDYKPAVPTKLTLKLLIHKERNKVFFAESSKDFVDFLFKLLSLPLSTVTNLPTNNSMVGSIGNLCQSIENLSVTYLQPNKTKASLLKPRLRSSDVLALLSNSEGGGLVTDLVTYMVLDDLVVKPMSAISCLTLINKFGISGTDVLEERVVYVGANEGLQLLKASLQSNTVLTTVFLRN